MRTVESGAGKEAAKEAEIRWIEQLTSDGAALVNRMTGGCGAWETSAELLQQLRESTLRLWRDPAYRARHNAAMRAAIANPEYRARRRQAGKAVWDRPEDRAKMLPQITALGHRIRTPDDNAALSAKTKGKQKNWSEEGRKKVEGAQFKTGHDLYQRLSDEARESHRRAAASQWDDISPEERSRQATERNLAAWAKRTPESRAELGAKISAGLLKNPKRLKEISAIAAKALWKNMTPERKALMIERRGSPERRSEIASQAAKALWAKRNIAATE